MNTAVREYYSSGKESFLEGLKEFLRIPSVSTLREHEPDILRAAKFLVDELTAIGLRNVRLIEGLGHPLVSAEWLEAPGKPTLLLYGHYDVQPPDPLDEWTSPPFEPQVRGDDIFARGAVDDKGQTYLLLKAVEGFLKTTGKLRTLCSWSSRHGTSLNSTLGAAERASRRWLAPSATPSARTATRKSSVFWWVLNFWPTLRASLSRAA
jgi:acetylornithine deacetylase/succinyl-diaminopimelate desuccinylase-like protein